MFVRWSNYLLPTRKEAPAEARPPLGLMIRAGLVRRTGPGSVCFLPLGRRVLEKIARIVREELEAIGALEIGLPPPGPRPTREEALEDIPEESGIRAVLPLVAGEINSWRDLPLVLHHIGSGPRGFPLHEAFGFYGDGESFEESHRKMLRTYHRIFARCGLTPRAVETPNETSDEGASLALVVPGSTGEEEIAVCTSCGYAADRRLTRTEPPPPPPGHERTLELVETPEVRTVEGLVRFLGVSPAQVVKTFLYVGRNGPMAVLLRGDHELEEAKLRRALRDPTLRRVDDPDEARKIAGASFGFLGPVGLSVPIWADEAVREVPAAVVGGNREGYHYVGARAGRDFRVEGYLDLRRVREGDPCGRCGAPLLIKRGIKVAELLGKGATEATYLDRDGQAKPVLMGWYSFRLGRLLEAMVERHRDDAGIIWPVEIAPFHVVITVLRPEISELMGLAEGVASALGSSGFDVLLDDRDRSPGEKFHDAKLIGIPVMLVVGPKAAKRGEVEAERRWDGARTSFPAEPGCVVQGVRELLRRERG